MKMVGRIMVFAVGLVAAIMVFSGGCVHGRIHSAVQRCSGLPFTMDDSLLRAKRWLQTKQNSDGSWGQNPTNQVALTSLAILAFLSTGESPASEDFGLCVEAGMKRIMTYADLIPSNKLSPSVENRNISSEQILYWALAESFNSCRNPILMQSARNMFKRLVGAGKQFTSVWQALALKASLVSDNPISLGEEEVKELMRDNGGQMQTNDLLSVVIQMTKMQLTGEVRCQTVKYKQLLGYVRNNAHVIWIDHDEEYPLLTWYLSSMGLFRDLCKTDASRWENFFEILRNQRCLGGNKNIGWWEVPISKNGKGMRERDMWGGHDADIYATCLVLLLAPPPRVLPVFITQPAEQDADEIVITIPPTNEYKGK